MKIRSAVLEWTTGRHSEANRRIFATSVRTSLKMTSVIVGYVSVVILQYVITRGTATQIVTPVLSIHSVYVCILYVTLRYTLKSPSVV
jgi:hypothetical protein